MTGADLARIEQLPDTCGMKHEVLLQRGHMVNYGAPVEQAVRLAGATVVPFGGATDARPYQLAATLSDQTAAALFVVSHHCVDYGQIPLEHFCAICHERGVPVIVDAASEYDLSGFLAAGRRHRDLQRPQVPGRPDHRASSPAARTWCALRICRTSASAAA